MDISSNEQSSELGNIDYSKYIINLVLSQKTRKKLSTDLNPPRCLPTDDGLPKDWRGLASLVGLNVSDISFTEPDPTDKILELWFERHKNTCTIQILKNYLCQLDRWDIYDDTKEMIDNDIKQYIRIQENSSDSATKTNLGDDETALTTHDIIRLSNGLTPQHYDAFVLFAEADIEFATDMMRELEDHYKLKLCTKNRDLIGGHVFEHSLIMKLISERCNRLLIVVTQAFLECPLFHFFVQFSQALGIEQQIRKIVPLKLENCPLPRELSYYHLIDYTKKETFRNFWDKLYLSITSPTHSEIKRRATTISSAQTRPVIQPRPKSESYAEIENDTTPPSRDQKVHFNDGTATVTPGQNGTKKPGKNIIRQIFRIKFKKNGKQKLTI